jgi:hypothetical protein
VSSTEHPIILIISSATNQQRHQYLQYHHTPTINMRFEAIFLGATLAALSIAHHPPHPIAANDDGYALAARNAHPPKPHHGGAANDEGYALAARDAHPPKPHHGGAANDEGYALAARDAKAPPKPHPIAANDDGYALAARKAKVFHA